jgi:hypothetical protein
MTRPPTGNPSRSAPSYAKVGGQRVPNEARLRGFIEGWGTTAIVAVGPAAGRAWAAGGGTAREAGWGVPQAGLTGSYVFHLGKTPWISPLSGCGG